MPRAVDFLGKGEDPAATAVLQRRYRQLINNLRTLRERFAKGRFYRLDEALGRRSGFLTNVFAGRDTLTIDRLVVLSESLNVSIEEIVSFDPGASRQTPLGAPGYLPTLKKSRRYPSRLAFVPAVCEWSREVEIRSGSFLELGQQSVLDNTNTDPETTVAITLLMLRRLAESQPSALDSACLDQIARACAAGANDVRKEGKLDLAADLLDVAFRLEAKARIPLTRAFIYRMGAYLTAEMGFLSDAGLFAERAQRLSLLTRDANDYAHSTFVAGTIRFHQGEPFSALLAFRSCLVNLDPSSRLFRISAIHGIASALIELGELEVAAREADALDREIQESGFPLNRRLQGLVESLKADLASRQGDATADDLFAKAKRLFAEARAPLEILVVSLREVQHLLRSGRVEKAVRQTRSCLALLSDLEHHGLERAVTTELIRLAVAGKLSQGLVDQTVKALQFPGVYRAKLRRRGR